MIHSCIFFNCSAAHARKRITRGRHDDERVHESHDGSRPLLVLPAARLSEYLRNTAGCRTNGLLVMGFETISRGWLICRIGKNKNKNKSCKVCQLSVHRSHRFQFIESMCIAGSAGLRSEGACSSASRARQLPQRLHGFRRLIG